MKIFKTLLMAVVVSGLSFFVSKQLPWAPIEGLGMDAFVNLSKLPRASNDIVLIEIKPSTIEQLGHEPLAHHHQLLIETLTPSEPLAILYTIPLADIGGTDEDLEQFAKAIESNNTALIGFLFNSLGAEPPHLAYPFDKVPILEGPITKDDKDFFQDGITRRSLLSFPGRELYPMSLLRLLQIDLQESPKAFSFNGVEQTLIGFPKGSFQTIRFEDIIDTKILPMDFKNKIVIIGRNLGLASDEYVKTPITRFQKNPLLPVHALQAQAFDSFVRGDTITFLAERWIFALAALLIFINVLASLALKPVSAILIIGFSGLLYTGVSFFALNIFRVYVPFLSPLLTSIGTYYLLLPFLLIREYRRNWEISQKNSLLREVETLKTNFIGMISHDLNTPLSRIVGLTSLLKNSADPADRQLAINRIESSAQELLRLIGRILKYGQIEAKNFKIDKRSTDINDLVQSAVQALEPLAKEKSIEIRLEFEELFPSWVDPDLLRQSLVNLIENAIKYSPTGSSILIVTEDTGAHNLIQVSDQGPGISSEDQTRIFTRFFRSLNPNVSETKGTGLGLYLAKYFCELNGGELAVDSALGMGSTFSIKLPHQNLD